MLPLRATARKYFRSFQLNICGRTRQRVAILGQQEVADGTVTLKDLRRQDQFTVPRDEVVSALRVELAQPLV